MNREIKFRGKKHNSEWVYGSLVYSNNIDTAIHYEIGAGAVKRFGWCYVDSDTVGQFTGLKDKNGKEIYEGDIIKSTDYPFIDEDKVNYLGIVSCDTHDAIGEFYMNLYVTKESKKRGISNGINLSFYELNMDNVEVVGNIFDNKGMFRDSDDKIMQWYLED